MPGKGLGWQVTGLAALLAIAAASDPRRGCAAEPPQEQTFDPWASLASAHPLSPATATGEDRDLEWTAPDGRRVHLVVKVPHPRSGAAEVTVEHVPEGADARPYFERAVARVRQESAARLRIPPGTYVFRSLGADRLGHWVLRGLTDVTIEGAGATLVFTQNESGIYLSGNQRVRMTGVRLEYALHTASLGEIRSSTDGNVLVIDPQFAVSDADAVTYLSEYDPQQRNWVHGGLRIILPPGSSGVPRYLGNQTYSSGAFRQARPGQKFIVFHYWYGGNAIKISDIAGEVPSEDLSFDRLTIASGPGMGVFVYGMKRGLAITNSRVAPDPGSLISTTYDALHVLIAGGDVLLESNYISGQGDDGINFNNAMHPIVAAGGDGSEVTLGAYSRFIRPGDALAFFDANGDMVGSARATSISPLGGLNNRITLAEPVTALSAAIVARDLELINSRYVIAHNTIRDCQCHGMLLQAPFGLAADNVITGIAFNAIRLLTNLGTFKEGVGAFDVTVRDNSIAHTGGDSSLRMPWSAISAYGAIRNNAVTASLVNSDIQVSGNHISDVPQGCITIMSSRRVSVSDNVCEAKGVRSSASAAITVRNSLAVSVQRNAVSGGFSAQLDVDPLSTRDVTATE